MRNLSVILLFFSVTFSAFAVTKGDGELFRAQYNKTKDHGNKVYKELFSDNGDTARAFSPCMGDTEWEKKPVTALDYFNNNVKGHQYVYMLVAHELVEKGGRFCETLISAQRDGSASRPYTVYYKPKDARCYWMCQAGFYGEGCKFKQPTSCVSDFPWETKYRPYLGLTEDKFNTSNLQSVHNHIAWTEEHSENIEENIPMLYSNLYYQCNDTNRERDFNKMAGWKQQEHDVIVGIVGKTKQNMFRSAVVLVRAGGTRNQVQYPTAAWPVVSYYPNDDVGIDLVLDGYEKTGNAYELKKTGVVCSIRNLCPSTPAAKYDSTQHKIELYAEGKRETVDCVSYFRCKSGAFASKTDFTCIECGGLKEGVASDGTCMKCSTGKVYKNGECIDATPYSKAFLRTGPNGDVNDLSKQCWIKDNPDDYKECIAGE